jgi:hypothetical protein
MGYADLDSMAIVKSQNYTFLSVFREQRKYSGA